MESYPPPSSRDRSATDIAIAKHIRSIDHSNCELYSEDGFWVFDLDIIRDQLEKWRRNLPLVRLFYAVKSNPSLQLLTLLANSNIGFDCATHAELSTILSLSVPPKDIIYANPCKAPSHLRYASTTGVTKTTFDNATELRKIKTYHPTAECVLRIKLPSSTIHTTTISNMEGEEEGEKVVGLYELSKKYGVTLQESRELLALARKLELNVVGVAFHIGSGQKDYTKYASYITEARKFFALAGEFGYTFTLLDIGGGFMDDNFEIAAETINAALEAEFGGLITEGSVEVIAEPGRYVAHAAFTMATSVIAVREEDEGDSGKRMIYLADGIYSRINPAMWPGELTAMTTAVRGRRIEALAREDVDGSGSSASSDSGIEVKDIHRDEDEVGMEMKGELREYVVWGPTCDSGDMVYGSAWYPGRIEIGDWLVFKQLGAYSINLGNSFNGFRHDAKIYCVNQ
ncbi:hypothetical protein TWF694_008916 [Orbilia ellipsospora]|uniref:Orn/DAP/Arg decarboxylase 2 N-terminal domain-containing protein n=1 Tax=Orbilia ellipsospora TaxID=2528407 RepID=A0AAV9XEJ8_9PEZI